MSEIKSESISSLVDDHSPSTDDNVSAHLVDNMLKDEHSSTTWQNYHLIGDVLRDEVPQSLQLDLSDKISRAIAQEATILSPNSSTQTFSKALEQSSDDKSNDNTVVDGTSRFKAKMSRLLKPLVKPIGQVAIAASAAGLMIVGVQHNLGSNDLVTPSQVVQTVPLTGYANPVSFNVQPIQSSQNLANQQKNQQTKQLTNAQIIAEKLAQQRRLQALLQDHNQQVKLGN